MTIGDSKPIRDRKTARVAVYVDGFNLYFGLKASGLRQFYWLDVCACATMLTVAGERLSLARYFSARISGPGAKQKRQSTYLDALATLPGLTMHFGKYRDRKYQCHPCSKPFVCPGCGAPFRSSEEKMTDVNIAVNLLVDAAADAFDSAIIVSGDSDLIPAVVALKKMNPPKRVVVAFPPRRHSYELSQACDEVRYVTVDCLARSQLPDTLQGKNGYLLTRPHLWRRTTP